LRRGLFIGSSFDERSISLGSRPTNLRTRGSTVQTASCTRAPALESVYTYLP
jgi:hypothetical protein